MARKSKTATETKGRNGRNLKMGRSLKDKMSQRLKAARFRYLNEQLYRRGSSGTETVFDEDPDSFSAYHEGFEQQVKQWPLNPLDRIFESILKIPGHKSKVIADFGCGQARLASLLPDNRVISMDLVSANDRVIKCDMANSNLSSKSVDIAVYCLSLMGEDVRGYLREANRVLKIGGLLKIAEVESRFEDSDDFVDKLSRFGFQLLKKDLSHNLFYFFDFKKTGDISKSGKKKLPSIKLAPCLYKKR